MLTIFVMAQNANSLSVNVQNTSNEAVTASLLSLFCTTKTTSFYSDKLGCYVEEKPLSEAESIKTNSSKVLTISPVAVEFAKTTRLSAAAVGLWKAPSDLKEACKINATKPYPS